MLSLFADVTFTQVMLAALTVGCADWAARAFLPDHIAGPGGWLIDTTEDDDVRA